MIHVGIVSFLLLKLHILKFPIIECNCDGWLDISFAYGEQSRLESLSFLTRSLTITLTL